MSNGDTLNGAKEAQQVDGRFSDKPASGTAKSSPIWVSKLPEWISKPLTNPDDMKALFRCWVILFGSTALLLAHPSLRTLGNAALFVLILNVRTYSHSPSA